MALTEEQLSPLRELKKQFDEDSKRAAQFEQLRAKRKGIQPQIAQLLESFLSHKTSIEDLRSAWDVKTRTSWNSFGLKGLSSAMFLNMLVKHIPDQEQTTAELIAVARMPESEAEGRKRLAAFEAFLEGQIKAGHVTRRLIQTARIPFFVSAFWHLQDTELWPMFYVSARQVFQKNGLYPPGSRRNGAGWYRHHLARYAASNVARKASQYTGTDIQPDYQHALDLIVANDCGHIREATSVLAVEARKKLVPPALDVSNVRSTELGPYYAVCIRQNVVVAKNVDLEVWAREMGVLRQNEEMVPEE